MALIANAWLQSCTSRQRCGCIQSAYTRPCLCAAAMEQTPKFPSSALKSVYEGRVGTLEGEPLVVCDSKKLSSCSCGSSGIATGGVLRTHSAVPGRPTCRLCAYGIMCDTNNIGSLCSTVNSARERSLHSIAVAKPQFASACCTVYPATSQHTGSQPRSLYLIYSVASDRHHAAYSRDSRLCLAVDCSRVNTAHVAASEY